MTALSVWNERTGSHCFHHLPPGSGSDTDEKKLEKIRWRRMKWKKVELEVQEDIYVMDDGVLKIREIKIVKTLKCN